MKRCRYLIFPFIAILLLYYPQAILAQTANPGQYQYVFTVAKDGSGDFKHIQDAIDAMRVYPLLPITLYIKNGVYREKIELPATNTDVRFIGESVEKTIIIFNDFSGRGNTNTFTSFTAKISGNRFRAENISFVNDAGPVGQAVALYVDADQAVFRNCRFLGNQDTIFTGGEHARQYFVHCWIEGTTDFIFGPATAVFDSCTLRAKANSYLTAASTTPGKAFGYVFLHCQVRCDSNVNKLYLGRPWRAAAKTVFLYCELPSAIVPEGWNNWSNPENEKTTWYGEYGNTGAGADISHRVTWSHQLTEEEAKQYTVEKFFSGTTSDNSTQKNWYLSVPLLPFLWPDKRG